MSSVWPCQRTPAEQLWPSSWETVSYSNKWPWLSTLHLLSLDEAVCVTVGLSKAFSWPPHAKLQHVARTNWGQNGHSASPTVPSSQEGANFILSRGESTTQEGEEEEKKKNSITQRLEKQAGELLGRRDCHVCINRHWFFCPALAPQPFILSFVVGAQRGCRNSVTVQLGPWGLCVRIDFTCKRGEGLEPLNKGRLCHQRAGWVKSHWMDNDTYCGKRGRRRDGIRGKGRNDWYCGRRRERGKGGV